MPKLFSLALIVGGVVLLVFAAYAGDSVSSGFSKLFQGTPDNRTILLLVLGVLTLGAGLVGISRSSRT